MAISFQAIGENCVTFLAASSAEAGAVCKISANGTVAGCDEEDVFCGVVTHLDGGKAAVMLSGYTELAYSGTAPSVGYGILAADGDGGVMSAETGRNCLIVSVDTTAGIVGLFL